MQKRSGIPWYKIHKFERNVDPNGNKYINFYKIADDEEPFHVQWYGGENDVICGHVNSSDNDNQCPKCSRIYKEGEEWLCGPVCNSWFHEECFYEWRLFFVFQNFHMIFLCTSDQTEHF